MSVDLDFDWFPEEEIIDSFFNVYSSEPVLITRTIDGATKTTKFFKDELVGDLILKEVKAVPPFICLKIGEKVEDEIDLASSGNSVIITAWVIVDSVVAARTKLIAEKEAKRLMRNHKQLAYNNYPDGNLIIIESHSFLMNNRKNNELHEVHWRTFFKVGYR